MTEPLVKQIVDLKEEHSLMLEALKRVQRFFNEHQMMFYDPDGISYEEMITSVTVAKIAAEMGNERRLERGNVDLPDRRGMK